MLQSNKNLFNTTIKILQDAREQVFRTVNQTMVRTYFEIGRLIVEEEQGGKHRAEYGKQLIKELSKVLTIEFGRGFSSRNIFQMRQFYLAYQKVQTVSAQFKLSWSHYLKLMRIDDADERRFYEIEAGKNNWSFRELQRQYDSALYTRLALSRNESELKKLTEQGLSITKPKDAIKDPYILEFLGLPEIADFSENDLKTEIINKLEQFLLELGNGFTFVSRQKRITFEDKHFYIDLVFYNRILKCFVLIDLKIGELKHQDIGQMLMYVNYYDRKIRLEDENKTIGLILSQNKSEAVVRYTLPENNEQIFASKYKTVLPSKKELKSLLNQQIRKDK